MERYDPSSLPSVSPTDGLPEAVLWDCLAAMVVVVDEHGQLLRWNAECERITGHALPEVIGKCAKEVLFPDVSSHQDEDGALAEFFSARPHPDIGCTLERELCACDGTTRYVAWQRRPVRYGGSTHGWCVLTGTDLTERRRIEEAREASELTVRGVISAAADAIILLDGAQTITTFNTSAERIFGYAASEVIGAPLEILVPPGHRRAHRERIERFMANEPTAIRKETRQPVFGLRKDGEEFPAEASIAKLDTPNGGVLTVVLRDVTEDRRLEQRQAFLAQAGQALASSLDYDETLGTVARLAVENLADVCIVDIIEIEGRLRVRAEHRDPALAKLMMRLSSRRLQRGSFLSSPELESGVGLLHPDIDAFEATSEEARRVLEQISPGSLLAVPLFARGGRIGSLTLMSTSPERPFDETDLRLAERFGRDAALAIENSRLYRQAREAILTRDQVLGTVAHDLRNPLNEIVLAMDLLTCSDAEASCAASSVRRSAERMQRLIRDLLDAESIEAGRLELERQEVALARLVDEAIQGARPRAERHEIEVRLDLPRALPPVFVDPDRVLQILGNLLDNAVKFTTPGGRIHVVASSLVDDVELCVMDSGRGIPPEKLPHVFDRFFHGHRSRGGGSGLGLAICKALVEAHGGRIRARNIKPSGAAFCFTLPIVRSQLKT